jgi:hypothetical protein
MYDTTNNNWILTDEMQRLQTEKKSGIELQERKHQDWDDNYELYRNKVKTNRLTQRQAVNIPLMKETIKTLLSKVDDAPEVEWKELGGDDQKELVYQEIWEETGRRNNFELIDILDKKNVLLYGYSAKKLNVGEEGVDVSVLDVYDTLIDPLYNPWNLESARFIIHLNIFRSVRDILADDRYTKAGKDELKIWADSPPGITQSRLNKDQWEKKMARLEAMGVDSGDFAYFAGGDRLINLTEHFTTVWNPKKKAFERRVVVYAEDTIELLNEPLKELIGVDEWPFVVWSEDIETSDIYPDSVADMIRTPNKVLNVWYSQLIENRTLKNFQMHWYMPGQNYTPQTYTPGPGVMLPAPPGDDISKVIKPVEVSGLDDTLEAIRSVTMIVERGTGATAIEKGQTEKGTQTLGEIQILVGKAGERATAMSKFYRRSWYELAKKWDHLMHANAPKFIKLYKYGRNGKVYPKRVMRDDWRSDVGYEPKTTSSSEQEANDVKTIQKWNYVLSQFPNNPALRKISQKRQLKILDLTPEELREVEEGEKQMQEQMVMPDINQMEQNLQTLTQPA